MNTVTRARWTPQYYQKVLALDPILHVMQDEKQGAVSYDMVTARSDGARNGAYTGVTLGQPGIGDGRTSPLFDGANDFNNVFSASLSAAFNGAEGTILAWMRVSAVGVWTDGATRAAFKLGSDANNFVRFRQKTNVNGTTSFVYVAGGVVEFLTFVTTSPIDWYLQGCTWSSSADLFQPYFDGVPVTAGSATLGVYAGALANGFCQVGAESIVPANVTDGYIAHPMGFDYALTAAQIADLAVRE